jgi:hypothetical protein
MTYLFKPEGGLAIFQLVHLALSDDGHLVAAFKDESDARRYAGESDEIGDI